MYTFVLDQGLYASGKGRKKASAWKKGKKTKIEGRMQERGDKDRERERGGIGERYVCVTSNQSN